MERHKLTSERLRLEPTSAHHAAKVFPYISDERLWEFFPHLRPATVEALRELYRRWERGNPYANRDEVWENWICFLAGTEIPIGGVQATILPHNVAYIAYVIYVNHQRQGFATEAARAVLEHLRSVHGIERVLADMNTQNIASIKVAEALGFLRVEEHTFVDRADDIQGDQYLYELVWTGTN